MIVKMPAADHTLLTVTALVREAVVPIKASRTTITAATAIVILRGVSRKRPAVRKVTTGP
jgi:hypothetical protein